MRSDPTSASMTNSNARTDNEQLQHLELVRALTREARAAVAAIEKNNLQQLQSAIGNQETLCEQLAARPWTPFTTPGTIERELHQAYAELGQANRVYEGVIKRSKRCGDLVLALYARFDVPALTERQTWVCEV